MFFSTRADVMVVTESLWHNKGLNLLINLRSTADEINCCVTSSFCYKIMNSLENNCWTGCSRRFDLFLCAARTFTGGSHRIWKLLYHIYSSTSVSQNINAMSFEGREVNPVRGNTRVLPRTGNVHCVQKSIPSNLEVKVTVFFAPVDR